MVMTAAVLLAVPGSARAGFEAALDGAQADAGMGTGSTATGGATLTLNAAGTALAYTITLVGLDLDGTQTVDPADDVTALHFHNAPPGANGAVVFGLIGPNHDTDDLVINPAAGTLTGIWEETDVNPLSPLLEDLNAGNLYLNVHTTGFSGGEIRGQVLRQIDGFEATLDEAQANAGMGTGSAATGTATLALNTSADGLSYTITLVGLDLDGAQTLDPSDDVTALHFHNAPPGANGGVVFGLIAPNHDTDDLVIDPAAGTLTGIWENTDVNPLIDQLAALDAGNLYLNVHTTSFPGGEIRGQVLPVDCTAPGATVLTLHDDTVTDARTFAVCGTIEVGPNYGVMGPDGDLTLQAPVVILKDDVFVGFDGRLVVEN
jgi:hypothetical protein